MRRAIPWTLTVLVFGLGHAGQAAQPVKSSWIPLRAQFEVSPEPLTTELAWGIEPDDRNWHRRFWVLDRQVRLEGLAAVRQGRVYSPQATGIVADAVLRLRPGDARVFSRAEDYPCQLRLDSVQGTRAIKSFSTLEGARGAGTRASSLWATHLEQAKTRLAREFAAIRAPSEAGALLAASRAFNLWLASVEDVYDERIVPEARGLELRAYRANCRKAKSPGGGAQKLSWKPGWQERLPQPVALNRRLIARAPARRWGGLYSVRVAIEIGGQELNGAFLVDTGAPTSMISPSWLQSQGMNPKFLREPGGRRVEARWSFAPAGSRGRTAQAVLIDRASVSGQEIPVQRFLLVETQGVIAPPRFAGSCCDGVLGTDFLSQFAVEFIPSGPSGLNLYARTGFDLGPGYPWAEVSYDEQGTLRSDDCDATWISGIWSGGAGLPVCPMWGSPRPQPRTQRIGMDFLGRGPFTLDLPHGRIWVSREVLDWKPPVNQVGLKLAFETNGKRVLTVRSVVPGSPASSLTQAGLAAGHRVVELAGLPARRLDDWEIARVLSGQYGKLILISWQDSQGKLKREKIRIP